MAFEEIISTITLEAGADLSAKQFTFVKANSSGQAVAAAAAGEPVVGVLQNKPSAAGRDASIAVGGVCKVSANEAISEGDLIATSADGQAAVATKSTVDTSDTGAASDPVVGSYVIGIALTSASAADEIVSVLLTHAGAVATTDA